MVVRQVYLVDAVSLFPIFSDKVEAPLTRTLGCTFADAATGWALGHAFPYNLSSTSLFLTGPVIDVSDPVSPCFSYIYKKKHQRFLFVPNRAAEPRTLQFLQRSSSIGKESGIKSDLLADLFAERRRKTSQIDLASVSNKVSKIKSDLFAERRRGYADRFRVRRRAYEDRFRVRRRGYEDRFEMWTWRGE